MVLGYCYFVLVNVLKIQGEILWYISNVFINELVLCFGCKLIEVMFVECVVFMNFGMEVNEIVFKLVCYYVCVCYSLFKIKIIVFYNVFYGCLLFIVLVGGQLKYFDGFGLKLVDIIYVFFNDFYVVKAVMDDYICVVVVELIQGEGGVMVVMLEFLQGLCELCD